jgi:ferric-dicitrate binding protein FerR (iron transport regulator)
VSDRQDSEAAAERAARDAVRALVRPAPEPAFRARLRREFTTGRFGRRVPVYEPQPWWAPLRVLVPVTAVFLVLAALALNRGPDWRLVSAAGAGRVTVNGTAFSADDARLAARLKRGGHVRVDGAVTLDLVAPGIAAVAMAPGAEMELSSAPGRWWARGMRAHVANGDAWFTTGRGFHGATLDVSTPEVSVRAVGTAFAVLRESGGTCVCVLEGRVRVGEAGGSLAGAVEVPQGMRRVVHADRSSETHPILDDSVHRLHHQRDVAGALLGR